MNNAIAKAVGFRWFERGKREWRAVFRWADISGGFGLALALCLFEEGYSLHVRLGWPNIFLKLPTPRAWRREPDEMMESWGFSFFERDIHLNWGRHVKIVHLPWDWTFVSWHVWRDGQWVAKSKGEYNPPYSDGRTVETHSYKYTLRNGTVQERTATIYGEVGKWRWRWSLFGWPNRSSRSISITFSDEVGERTGSWKGGCIGCGYDWLDGETMLDALRRMEIERKF